MADPFYNTPEWLAVREQALARDHGRCSVARADSGRFTTTDARERLIGKTIEEEHGFGSPCWIWTAAINNWGYGTFWLDGTNVPAHRAAYSLFVGEIPDGAVVDHLCAQPSCVNPEHLEAVTEAENILRGRSPSAKNAAKTSCDRGHEFTPANTYWYRGSRLCRTCRSEAARRRSATPEARELHRKEVAARKKLYGGREWAAARGKALERDGHRCSVSYLLGGECSSRLHVHHIVPVAEGGSPYDLSNLATVCARHHPRLERAARALRVIVGDIAPCPHRHQTRQGRLECERKRRRTRENRVLARLAA